MSDLIETDSLSSSNWSGEMAIDQISLEDICEQDQLEAICQGFSALNDIGIKLVSQSGREVVDVSRAGGLTRWLLSQPKTQNALRNFLIHLNQAPINPENPTVLVEPISELKYLVLPITYDFELIGRIICGPYTEHHLPQIPSRLGITDAYEAQRYRVLRGAIPRRLDDQLKENMNLLMRTLSSIIHAGYRAQLSSKLHCAAMQDAYAELQQKNEELTRKNTELEELGKLKSQFLATLSHELRTPLTTILGQAELLLQPQTGTLNDAQLCFVQSVLARGRSLNELIGNLLSVSELDSKPAVLHVSLVRPLSILQQLVLSHQSNAERAEIELKTEAPENIAQIRADRHKLRQILDQVLLNALKFTKAGGHVKVSLAEVECDWSSDQKGVAFTFKDDGIGIDPSEHEKIFEPFYQVDRSATRAYAGTGIGLHLVKQLVLAHDAKIELQSALGLGAEFKITFPCKSPKLAKPKPPVFPAAESGVYPALDAALLQSEATKCESDR